MRRLVPIVLAFVACTHSPSAPSTPDGRTSSSARAAKAALPRDIDERFDKPDAAAAFDAMRHAAPAGVDPQERYAAARAQMATMPHYATVRDEGGRAHTEGTSSWQFLGPGNIGGRTRALVFDPSNDNTMYAAGVSGGIWKSTNGGEAWTPIGDALVNLDVSSMAIDPNDPLTIF